MFQTIIDIDSNELPFMLFSPQPFEDIEKLISSMPISVERVDLLTDEEFSKIRNSGFGASDSAVLLEVAYNTPKVAMTTIDTLLYNKEHNIYDEDIANKASVRKGKDLEALLIEKSSKILNATIIKPTSMYTNNRGLNTNFDGIIFKPVVKEGIIATLQPYPLEIKLCTVWARKNYDWSKGISEFDYIHQNSIPERFFPKDTHSTDLQTKIKSRAEFFGIPPYYYTQLQQQMLFTNSDYGYLAVMDDSEWTMYYFFVARDDEIINELQKRAFHNYVILCKRKGISLDFPETNEEI